MKKRIFIIHGWDGYPEECWFPWLKKELIKKGFKVYIPRMPNPDVPRIKEWVSFLKKIVKKADKDTYFVGHSIGCQAILRYLSTIKQKIGGTLFVAGWFDLEDLETEEEKKIAKEWIKTPISFSKIKRTTNSFIAILSDNDPFGASKKNRSIFKSKLGAKIMMVKGKGHFSADTKTKKLPIALKELLRIAG